MTTLGHDWTVCATVRVFILFCTTITAGRRIHNLAVREKILVLIRIWITITANRSFQLFSGHYYNVTSYLSLLFDVH